MECNCDAVADFAVGDGIEGGDLSSPLFAVAVESIDKVRLVI
jgi:hypothetical protein